MFRKKRKTGKRPGEAPGSLIYVGEERTAEAKISVIDYGPEHFSEQEMTGPDQQLKKIAEQESVTWINVEGIHHADLVGRLGSLFDLHPLLLEDVLHTNQRPKTDFYPEHVFFVLRMLQAQDLQGHKISTEQVSFVLGKGYVISFQEVSGDVFEPIRERIRSGRVRIRSMGPDYLFYALIDAVVDHYFLVMESLGHLSETLELEVFGDATQKTLRGIQRLKADLVPMRRAIWPVRDALSRLIREENPLVTQEIQVFLHDVYDHSVQVLETVEALRDSSSSLLDIYLSVVSNRMNEVMKVLTVIATIFIPLTFIVGVYGMNFDYMPELHYVWAYPVVWLIMVVLALLMLYFFRRKNWL
jgi:magnesium transporter